MKSKNHLLALVYDLIDLNVGHKQKIMQKFEININPFILDVTFKIHFLCLIFLSMSKVSVNVHIFMYIFMTTCHKIPLVQGFS